METIGAYSLGRFAILSGILLAAGSVMAQEQTLEEIIVTAEFREANLQDTPIAITAVNAEMLDARGQTDIAQVADTYHAWRNKDGGYEDEQGFCKAASLEDVRKHKHVLTPGRYVGIPDEEDDGVPFEDKMTKLAAELAEVYAVWGGYAYGRGLDGVPARPDMENAYRRIDVAAKNIDTREHDIADSDDYYQDHGGMGATVRALTGAAPGASRRVVTVVVADLADADQQLSSAAAATCAIIMPEDTPGDDDKNGGNPSLISGFTSRSVRRSLMLIKSVSAIAA